MATLDPVNIGTPDQGDGDPARTAFNKVNLNDSALNAELLALSQSEIPLNRIAPGTPSTILARDDDEGLTVELPTAGFLNHPVASQAEMEAGVSEEITSMSAFLVARAIAALAATASGLQPVDNNNTSITLAAADFGKTCNATSDSAVTITIDAQTVWSAGSKQIGIRKGGAGTVTVQMESGAGYFSGQGDDFGNAPATASFTVYGYAELEWRSNVGGNAAVFLVSGDTSLARSVGGALTVQGTLTAAAALVAQSTLDVTGTLTPSGALATPASLSNAATFRALLQIPEVLQIAVSDEATALTTGTAKVTFRMPFAMTLTGVRASVGTAPTGAALIVDINEGGTTILSTKLSIDATEKTSTTAASAAVISDSSLADDAEITIDVDQIGSTVAGAGLKVALIGRRT
jgi:hypothetical protein